MLKLHCNACKRETRHEVQYRLRHLTETEIYSWSIIQCRGCETPSFHRVQYLPGSDEDNAVGYDLYPTREHCKAKTFLSIPSNLDQLYRAVIDAYNNKSFLLCSAGLRALLEGICADQKIKDGPKRDLETGLFVMRKDGKGVVRGNHLEHKIEALGEKGLLTPVQVNALHEHRFLGNKALHELHVPDVATLAAAIAILEHALENLYTIQAQADGLRRIRIGH